jgi:RHS repeat-associated protein
VFSYSPDDEVSSETYDANGNATQVGAKSFTYDSENHMMSMSTAGTSVNMIYDGDGNRVAKTINSVTTQYLVDDMNPTGYAQVVEEVVGGVVSRQYTYGLARISENLVADGAWAPSFYGYDGGGNVRNLTNSAGAVTDQYEYDAFGNSFTKVGTTPNNYLYRGEQYDPDLELYYLRARYYNPATGRFLSRDPENGYINEPASLHKYLYANGDPVNGIDPKGREELVEYVLNAANRVFIYTQVYVPFAFGTIQFYGSIGAGIAALTALACYTTEGCGPEGAHPAPGGYGEGGAPVVAPGGAGAMH